MCGLTGFWQPGGFSASDAKTMATAMAQRIANRGPDDVGVWVDGEVGIALAHRRLSILDLSSAGHQPMISASGRYVLVFNGEIYNHLALRKEMESMGASPVWRGYSDTETLLTGFELWGMEAMLKRTVGMFAIVLWDRADRILTLARDRMGEKPLYYGWQGNTFLFGSELKALKSHPAFKSEIDRDVLALLMRHNYIPTPYSIYRGIRKLLPGAYLQLSNEGKDEERIPVRYWSLQEVARQGQAQPFAGSDAEAVEALETLLMESVGLQTIADVPLGAFLSGGIDSSIIVALMQAQSSRPVKTFSIGFHEKEYNEAENARIVAQHLGTDHTELYVTPREAMDLIPLLPALYDEPFSDSSQIPTFLVSQITRRSVTVSLSGDGGDELFCGYGRYFKALRMWSKIKRVPSLGRKVLSRSIRLFSSGTWNGLTESFHRILPSQLTHRPLGDRLHLLADVLSCDQPEALYRQLVSHWKHPAGVVIGANEPPTVLTRQDSWPGLPDFQHLMMYLDAMSYLPDDILVKVDRAAMWVSLETRVPFLDHRVVEFAWSLPLFFKVRDGQSKWILRQVLYKYLPQKLIERPKMGFGVPIDSWLRGPLRDWVESLLDEKRLKFEGFFDPEPIREKWLEHLSGKRNWQYYLWDVLMFQAWLDQWV